MRHHLLPTTFYLAALATAGACSVSAQAPDDELIGVEDGKADDYYSNVSVEYEARGSVRVAMTDAEFADAATRKDIVERRLTAVGLYLTAYVTDKFEGIDANNDGRISEDEIFFRNVNYGSFRAMVRTQSGEVGNLTRVSNGVYNLRFELDLAGPRDLRELLPRVGTSSPFQFELKMPEGATVDPAGVPRGAIRNWSPETETGPVETHRLSLVQLPIPKNAYLPYDKYVDDGVLDITIVNGWDYNNPRADAMEIREQYKNLVTWGFQSPVARFEELTATSGPLVGSIMANGREVAVEVRLYYADMFSNVVDFKTTTLDEIVKRDVFFYNGHAGPYYGFYLDANDIAKVSSADVAAAPFTDKQQLFVAQGCQTYSQYADMVYASPAKSEDNLDVITTVNYSYGQGTVELLERLVTAHDDGTINVPDAYGVVAELNANWVNSEREVFYGITGIAGNSAVHPFANVAKVGTTCETADDCGGASSGNLCFKPTASSATKQCAARALANRCPTGLRFKQLRSGSTIVDSACVK